MYFTKKLLLTALLTAVILLAGCSSTQETTQNPPADPSLETETSAGEPAGEAPAEEAAAEEPKPALLGSFTATDLDGNEVSQDIFAEHDLTMVNVWATFCGPCLSEMPDLGKLNTEYGDQGFQVVGIVMDTLEQDGSFSDSQIATAKEIVEKTGASYLHLLPSEDLIIAKLQEVTAVPETFFVDKNGALVGKSYMGARKEAEWKKIIDENLKLVKEVE